MVRSKPFLQKDFVIWDGKYEMLAFIIFSLINVVFSWLTTNGEAIYESKPWIFQNDTLTPGVWYTARSGYIYAMVQRYPYIDRAVSLRTLSGHINRKTKVSMLGYPRPLEVS